MTWGHFFQSPDIQAIPLVEVELSGVLIEQENQRQRSCVLGVAAWVEHRIFGTFAGWNRLFDVPRDVADYLWRIFMRVSFRIQTFLDV